MSVKPGFAQSGLSVDVLVFKELRYTVFALAVPGVEAKQVAQSAAAHLARAFLANFD